MLDIAKNSLTIQNDDTAKPPLLLLPSMVRYVMGEEKQTDNNIESYCLAWFKPSGIKFTQLAVEVTDESDDEDQIMAYRGNGVVEPFAPGGEQLYAGSEDEKKSSRRQPSRSTTPTFNSLNAKLLSQGGDDKYENCLYQWNGCETAEDVLEPFGFASSFIKGRMKLSIDPSKNRRISHVYPRISSKQPDQAKGCRTTPAMG